MACSKKQLAALARGRATAKKNRLAAKRKTVKKNPVKKRKVAKRKAPIKRKTNPVKKSGYVVRINVKGGSAAFFVKAQSAGFVFDTVKNEASVMDKNAADAVAKSIKLVYGNKLDRISVVKK